MNRELLHQTLDALRIGRDSAFVEAANYHEAMRGYRQHMHDQMDAYVKQIDDAIGAVRAELAKPDPEPYGWIDEAGKFIKRTEEGGAITCKGKLTAVYMEQP